MAYDRRALVGVGGWLAFFIITLCLNALASPLAALAIASGMNAPVRPSGAAWSGYVAVNLLIGVVKAVAYAFMAWRLNARQEPGTPRLVIKLLWALVLLPPLVDAAAAALLLDVSAHDAGVAFGAGMFRPLIYAAIWTAYLLRSERVANTYTPGRAEDEALAAVFE